MAVRPVYIADNNNVGVKECNITFTWHPGYSLSQKQKSISELHNSAKQKIEDEILEVSSKSPNKLGVNLSAFNLKTKTIHQNKSFSVETGFQSSKVFEYGGPYIDLLYVESKKAKMDPRIKNSGRLKEFRFFNYIFSLEPKTFFYDWLYINTLLKNKDIIKETIRYNAFTDIEFNPKKSLNCQASSIALFKSLHINNLINGDKIEPAYFKEITRNYYKNKNHAKQETLKF